MWVNGFIHLITSRKAQGGGPKLRQYHHVHSFASALSPPATTVIFWFIEPSTKSTTPHLFSIIHNWSLVLHKGMKYKDSFENMRYSAPLDFSTLNTISILMAFLTVSILNAHVARTGGRKTCCWTQRWPALTKERLLTANSIQGIAWVPWHLAPCLLASAGYGSPHKAPAVPRHLWNCPGFPRALQTPVGLRKRGRRVCQAAGFYSGICQKGNC